MHKKTSGTQNTHLINKTKGLRHTLAAAGRAHDERLVVAVPDLRGSCGRAWAAGSGIRGTTITVQEYQHGDNPVADQLKGVGGGQLQRATRGGVWGGV